MTIYAVNQDSGEWYQTRPESQTDTDYSFEAVMPGTYVVYAWLDEGDYGGSYSQAVPCGLGVECQDHSLVLVIVEPGLSAIAVDVCDWYGPLPPPPPD